MDINPLVADLYKYKEELVDSLEISIGFKELTRSDWHIASGLAEIKGESFSESPLQQIAALYNLPLEVVTKNIRDFVRKMYRKEIWGDMFPEADIEFQDNVCQLDTDPR